MEGNSVFGCLCCFGAFRWCCIGYETLAFHVRGRAQTETFKSGELKKTFGFGGGGKNGTKWNCVITNFVICTFIKLVEMITLRRMFFLAEDFPLRSTQNYTGLLKMTLGVTNNTFHMQPHVISFYGVTSRIRFIMFLLFPQVSRN